MWAPLNNSWAIHDNQSPFALSGYGFCEVPPRITETALIPWQMQDRCARRNVLDAPILDAKSDVTARTRRSISLSVSNCRLNGDGAKIVVTTRQLIPHGFRGDRGGR
jgi:hypothetical protein